MEISKLLMLGAIFALPAGAADGGGGIAIKQFHLGMSEEDVRLLQFGPQSIIDGFTVGGARVWDFRFIYDVGTQTDRERRNADRALMAFSFRFSPMNFEAIKSAVKFKYPSTQCQEEALQNRMGAKYVGEFCTYKAKNGDQISMSQYAGSLDNGSLEAICAKVAKVRKESSTGKKDDI